MKIQLDDWQKRVLETEGNIILMSGRRVGKSEILVIDCGEYAIRNKDKTILVISHTERQAYWLFEKIHEYLYTNYNKMLILKGKKKPTKSQLRLINGTKILCLPTGLNGSGIRGIPADRIYPDELDYIPEIVWQAVTPMLLTTGGVIRGGTTPNPDKDKTCYVYQKMEKNPKFTVFNISTEEVMRNRPISHSWTEKQRNDALEHLENEKKTMSKLAYAVEYLGQRVDQLKRFFSDELIAKTCILERKPASPGKKKYLGVDIARMGADQSAYAILEKHDDIAYQIENITTTKTLTTDTYEKIIELDKMYNFREIGIDAGSGTLGVGILDFLKRESIGRKVKALNNASRSLDKDDERRAQLLGEDMFQNLLALMEHGKIKLLKDDEVILSLKSVQYDIVITPGHKTQHKVFSHVNSDVVEAIKRAAQIFSQDKSLKVWATSKSQVKW